MPVPFEKIEPLLLKVEKPARYVGGEFNQIVKEGAGVKARVCLAFPDVYDLGMSYHGYGLLYERVNANPAWAAERTFTPWPDFESVLREAGLPLYALESRRALHEFDLVGFTLQHEVNYTNILTMLDLGGIPLESKDRKDLFPIVIGGGEGAYSPEPMAPFIDAFVIGDGEEAMDDLCRLVERAKAEGWTRDAMLMALARTPGVYVPQFYDFEYFEDGRVKRIFPTREGVPPVVRKRHFNITQDKGAVRPVVPLLRTVHDRFAIEIRRGCVNGCRFCQAGMITRPVRERSVDQICEIAMEGIRNTGYDEISLLSLSSADYTAIGTLVRRMAREFGPRRVSISLPSLRINAFDIDIADEIRGVRKSGFTFAPEAGTERLRKVINKEVNQEDFFHIIEEVFGRGWQTVKFYFMVGLPTETDEDLDGIVEITRRAAEIGRRLAGRKAIVNVTLSPFVPKSNTPFMWEPQPDEPELNRRYEYVKKKLRMPNVDVKTNDTGSSFIEAVLARGDRRSSAALRRAWELGARFDGWDEYFSKETWVEAFRQVGLDPAFYANRRRGEDEVFPYDHIDSSLGKRFLWADQRRAWRMRVMEPCEVGKCAGCVACDEVTDHILALNQPGATEGQERYTKAAILGRDEKEARLAEGRRLEVDAASGVLHTVAAQYKARAREIAEQLAEKAAACGEGKPDSEVFSHYRRGDARQPQHSYVEPEKVQRIRVAYAKQGSLRYLSHLDMTKVLGIALRRARLPISYSEGFNPQPKIQFAPPLPLGFGARRELMDVTFTERVNPAVVLEAMNAVTVPGLDFLAAEEIDLRAASVDSTIDVSQFVLTFRTGDPAELKAEIDAALAAFEASAEFPAQVKKKQQVKTIDLRRSIRGSSTSVNGAGEIEVRLVVTHEEGLFVQPQAALGFILGRPVEIGDGVRAEREAIRLKEDTASIL